MDNRFGHRMAQATAESAKSQVRSLAENGVYPQFCMRAALDPDLFSVFRCQPEYTQVLEHVTPQLGLEYLELIKADAAVAASLNTFRKNDLYGAPRLTEYLGVGQISPTTLRYVKVLCDLNFLFGSLEGADICEIGSGYGGQCRVIDCFAHPQNYRLVDIRPALMLAARYLDNFSSNAVLSYRTPNELEYSEYDLFISNFAFSELPRKLQDAYLKKAIMKSKRGYITCNEQTPPEFNSYKRQELLETIPGAKLYEEVPLTSPKNCIIAWGTI